MVVPNLPTNTRACSGQRGSVETEAGAHGINNHDRYTMTSLSAFPAMRVNRPLSRLTCICSCSYILGI